MKAMKGRRKISVSSEWAGLLKALPGYDPFDQAGDCEFIVSKAEERLHFFERCLTHIKGAKAGEKFELERWQKSVIANLFGWIRPDGTRRYREALIYVPRKNGKSFLAAGICNCVLFCDGEQGAEIYCGAAEAGQARLVFNVAREQVLRELLLKQRAKVFQNSITIEDMASFIRPISADADTKYGFNTQCAVVDELHVQPDRDLVDVLLTSTGARLQPLIVYITTADYDRESICNEKRDYAIKVRDGIIDDNSFLPAIYEASRDADWKDEKLWQEVNPNLGVSVTWEYLRREFQRATETPTYENTFKRLHLNMQTESDVKWLSMDQWDSCARPVDSEKLVAQTCFAGLDLSSNQDVTAFVLVFPSPDGHYAVMPFFWIPEDNAREREKRDRVPYLTWASKGWMELTPGNVVDYDRVRAKINDLGKKYRIIDLAADRWNAMQIMTQLQGDGFNVIAYGQGFKDMSAPSKELEKLLISGKLAHGGNPVLRWMASNVSAEIDAAGNIKPSKKKSTERIDGIVALVMALGRVMVTPQIGSVYEERGLLSI